MLDSHDDKHVNLALGTAILTTELSVYGTICQRTLILHLMAVLSSHLVLLYRPTDTLQLPRWPL